MKEEIQHVMFEKTEKTKKKKKEKKVGVSFGHVGVKVEIVVELRQISLIRDVLGGNIGLLLVHVLWLDHDFGLDHRRFDVQDWSFGGNGDRSRSSQDVGMTPKTREVLHHVELPSLLYVQRQAIGCMPGNITPPKKYLTSLTNSSGV